MILSPVQEDTLHNQASLLRKSGFSYSEIRNSLGIPKSTLSYWFSKKRWSGLVKKRLLLKNKMNLTKKLEAMNKARRFNINNRYLEYKSEAKKSYEMLKNNSLFICGTSLYWGEGEKKNRNRVSVINTDPRMIELMVEYFTSILEVPSGKLRVALFLYKDIDINNAMNFWVKVVGLPKSQFIKTQILPDRSKQIKNKSTYGICNVYFSDTKFNFIVKEWIGLMFSNMRV